MDLSAYNPDPTNKWQSWQSSANSVRTPQLRNGNIFKLTPAEIIYYSAKENNVNPLLLIVKLQHEASLISQTNGDYQRQLDRSTGFDFKDSKPKASSYAGFYPQLVAASFQFNLWKQRYQTFESGLVSYSTDRNAPNVIRNLYIQYAPQLNKIAGTNYTTTPSNWQYVDDFRNISIAHIQTFLDQQQNSQLKNKNLFKDASATPNGSSNTGTANLANWQKQNLAYAQEYYNRYNSQPLSNVFGSYCGKYTYCYKWSRNAPAIGLGGYASAKVAFESLNSKGLAKRDSNFANAPIGSIVFYGNGTYGHAAIKVSETEIVSQGQKSAHDCTISKVSFNSFKNYLGYYAPSAGSTTLADPNVIAPNQRVSRGNFLNSMSSVLDRFDATLPKDPIEKAKLMGIVGNPAAFNQTGATPIIRQDSARMLINVIAWYAKNGRRFSYNGNANHFSPDKEISPDARDTASRASQLQLFSGDDDESGIKRFVGQRQLSQYESGVILDRLAKLMQSSQSTIIQPAIQNVNASSDKGMVGTNYTFSTIISNTDTIDRVMIVFAEVGRETAMQRSNQNVWKYDTFINQAGDNRKFEIRAYTKNGLCITKTGTYNVKAAQAQQPKPVAPKFSSYPSIPNQINQNSNLSFNLSTTQPADRVVLKMDNPNVETRLNGSSTNWGYNSLMQTSGSRNWQIQVMKNNQVTDQASGRVNVVAPQIQQPQPVTMPAPSISKIQNQPLEINKGGKMAFGVKVSNPDSVSKAEVIFTDTNGVRLRLDRQNNGDVWANQTVLTGVGTNRPYKIVVYSKTGGTVERSGTYSVK